MCDLPQNDLLFFFIFIWRRRRRNCHNQEIIHIFMNSHRRCVFSGWVSIPVYVYAFDELPNTEVVECASICNGNENGTIDSNRSLIAHRYHLIIPKLTALIFFLFLIAHRTSHQRQRKRGMKLVVRILQHSIILNYERRTHLLTECQSFLLHFTDGVTLNTIDCMMRDFASDVFFSFSIRFVCVSVDFFSAFRFFCI